MKLPRPIIYLAALGAFVLVLVALSALLLPRLVDSQLIRDKIGAEFTKSTAARVTFAKIAFLWFPRPAVLIGNARFSFADGTQGSIQTTKIYPSIFYLLTGRMVVRRALLEEPKISVFLPESSMKPFDRDELEKQIRAALVRLTTGIPAPRIEVSAGSAEIKFGDKAPVILENIAAQTVASPAELRFDFSSRSNLFDRLSIAGTIVPENLASQLTINLQRLKINESLALLPLQISDYAPQGIASLDVKVSAAGLHEFKASISGSTGPIVLGRHDSTAGVEITRFKSGIVYQDNTFQVDVEQLDLGAPRLTASGQLKIHSGSLAASAKVREVDIAEVGDLALRMVGDAEAVKKIFRYVPAGAIPEMNIQSTGRSFAEMAAGKNIVVSGSLRRGKIFIPGLDLELTNVSGSVRIVDNILEATDISGHLGATEGSNGKLRLGLEGKASPFHLDMLVQTRALELKSILLKLVPDKTFRSELSKLQNVEGELSGRVILGETMDGISPVVAISQANISATYEPVPFPIAIRSGRLDYEKKTLSVKNAQGSVGHSTFGALSMTLRLDGSRQIKVDSEHVALDLQQMDALLRHFKDPRSYLAKFQSARGHVELQKLALAGAYDEPTGWTFASTGSVNQAEIQHKDFPDRIILSRGKFAANQGRVIFTDTAAAMSDAVLIADGTFDYKQGGLIQFEASGMGTIGAQMDQWLSRYVELPEELYLRSPLKIAAGRLAWRAGGDMSFRGQMTVAGGPQLTLDAVKKPEGFTLPDLTIDDGNQRARMTLQLAKNNLDLSFTGELTQQTIDKIFTSFPAKGGSLQGDIQISAALVDPMRISARGQLSGSQLSIPWGTENAMIEKFSLEAAGESVVVRSADLRFGESHFTATGRIAGAEKVLRVDLDITGDKLDWQQLERSFAGASKQPQQKKAAVMSIPDVQGTIRFKADSFTFERFNVSPLEATAAISASGIRTEIKRGVVCGINTTGGVEVAGKDISLDFHFSAQDVDLEPATLCLTNQQSEITGTYSLTARVTGRGNREQLRSALKGDFQFNARDGEFVRSAGVDATFDYLNGTGDFAVDFPDLNKQTFPYRLLSAKGTIDGESLSSDEIIIYASPYTVTGQGRVDLQRKQVDVKGLVSVALPAGQVIKRIPIIGSIVGGSLVGIPVRIRGSLDRPEVSYLSPGDVGKELLNLPMRILGAPLDAIGLFVPSGKNSN